MVVGGWRRRFHGAVDFDHGRGIDGDSDGYNRGVDDKRDRRARITCDRSCLTARAQQLRSDAACDEADHDHDDGSDPRALTWRRRDARWSVARWNDGLDRWRGD